MSYIYPEYGFLPREIEMCIVDIQRDKIKKKAKLLQGLLKIPKKIRDPIQIGDGILLDILRIGIYNVYFNVDDYASFRRVWHDMRNYKFIHTEYF